MDILWLHVAAVWNVVLKQNVSARSHDNFTLLVSLLSTQSNQLLLLVSLKQALKAYTVDMDGHSDKSTTLWCVLHADGIFCITQLAFEHYSRYPCSRIIYHSVTSLSSAISLLCENHFGTRITMEVFIIIFFSWKRLFVKMAIRWGNIEAFYVLSTGSQA